MKIKKEDVYILFKFSQSQNENLGQVHGRYKVIMFFNENGPIKNSDYKKFLENQAEHLVFSTKEQLTEFAYRFIDESSYRNVHLLSANDYNIGLESCHDVTSFNQILQTYGFSIENQNKSSNKFFGKLF